MAKQSDLERRQIIEARRSGILTAAARLFAEKGYHRTTTREIAEAAGVAEGTIYNYFVSKEDLLVSMLNHLSKEQRGDSHFATGLNLPLRDALRAMFQSTMSEAKQNLAMAATVYSEALVNPTLRERYAEQRLEPLAAYLEQQLRTYIERGEAREVDIPLSVRITLAAQTGVAILLLLGDRALETASVDELVDALVDVFDAGLSAHNHTPER